MNLTPRERQVMALRAKQKGIREIAHDLAITPDTARKHRDNAVQRSGLGSEMALVLELARRDNATA
jgi:DNA-binding CsgD family transcriptional regulator